MMSTTVFWRTVNCGLIATFVMTMISFLQSGAGLPENHLAFFIPKFGRRGWYLRVVWSCISVTGLHWLYR